MATMTPAQTEGMIRMISGGRFELVGETLELRDTMMRTVPCRTCGAGPGEWCHTRHGNAALELHMKRITDGHAAIHILAGKFSSRVSPTSPVVAT